VKTNNEKITRELCEREDLIFFPKTHSESRCIQEQLIKMGYGWSNGLAQLSNTGDIISNGLVLLEGKIYTKGGGDPRDYLVCTFEQFAENYVSPAEMFNSLSKRLDVLEEYLKPKSLDKPVFKKPDSTP
jgi:hypothetical protein